MTKSGLVVGMFLALWSAQQGAGAAAPAIALEPVAEGLVHPVTATAPAGDPRLFVVEQIGRIRIVDEAGHLLDEPFLDIRDRLAELYPGFDERGLLGLAFHPDYVSNGRFYVSYSAPKRAGAPEGTEHTARVSEFRVSGDPDRADPGSERVVIEIDEPDNNHNGGSLAFGPEGMLYLALGDGGLHAGAPGDPPFSLSQKPDSLLGKVLRLDVSGYPYRIPDDNPFVGNPYFKPEIWAMGMRNPFRCTFDAAGTGAFLCGDVGEFGYEEIDLIEPGLNYGWRIKEGRHCYDPDNPKEHPEVCQDEGLTDPVIAYVNCSLQDECAGRSVIGGYVYRGTAIPELRGQYLFSDWAAGADDLGPPLYAATPAGQGEPWAMAPLEVEWLPYQAFVLGFGQDAAGELYLLVSNSVGPDPEKAAGRVYRIVPSLDGQAIAGKPDESLGTEGPPLMPRPGADNQGIAGG